MMTNETNLPDQSGQPEKSTGRRFFGWPGTSSGWWSLWLTLGFLLFFAIFWGLFSSGQKGGDTFFSNPWLAWSMLLAATSAIAGGIFATAAIFWKKERSIFIFLAFLLGLYVAFFAIMEIIVFPH
ncbi:MAG: hypothetical protein ABIG43_03745 [Chloroflexota bacterium]